MFFGTHVPVYPGTWESALVGCLTVHIVSIKINNLWKINFCKVLQVKICDICTRAPGD